MPSSQTSNRRCLGRHWAGWVVFLVFASLLTICCFAETSTVPTSGDSQPNPDDLTAEELFAQGQSAFTQGDWARAAALFGAFERNFGSAPELQQQMSRIRYLLASSLLRAKNFEDALPALEAALASEPPPEPQQIQELTFWKGVLLFQQEKYPAAREELEKFIAMFPNAQPQVAFWRRQNPQGAKIPEARLLIGSSWIAEGNTRQAVTYLEEIKPQLEPEAQGRATILQLYSLLEGSQRGGEEAAEFREKARLLILAQFPRMEELTQLAAFQMLTLQLGADFLDQGEYRKAIQCMQRVWPAERIVRRQEERQADLVTREEALEANPQADPFQKLQIQQMRAKVERELQNFRQLTDFDAALRLRLASAYQAMKRYREAALIIEDMLERMPPSKIVESASTNLVQCWNAIERWDKVIGAATAFEQKFPQSENLPLILYLKGIAQQQAMEYPDAIATFADIQKRFAKSEFAGRALFMEGFTNLLAENNPRAIELLTNFPKKFRGHDMEEAGHYWLGMAYSLDKQNEKAREVLADYLEKYPRGAFAGQAQFRRAYCAQQMMDFATSIAELRAFLKDHPGHENEAEALILLGDALMNEGEIEEGMAAYARIPPEKTRFFEEGWFKTGRALKLMEEYDRLFAHMMEFRKNYPQSPRVAEALFHAGSVLRQRGEEDAARQLYWDAIEEYVGNPSVRSVEDLFPALLRLYPGEEGARQFAVRVRDLREEVTTEETDAALAPPGAAQNADPPARTRRLRSLWAEALAVRKFEPQRAQNLLVEAAREADPRTTSPQLMADFADALLTSGDIPGAIRLYSDLIKWNPRAPQKDRALAELGILEKQRRRSRQALAHFERFLRETSGSRQTGRVLFAKAELEAERGKTAEAIASLEAVLASEATTGQERARALYEIGELHMRAKNPRLAQPYFQRLYVMYGRWRDWVAKAYLRSGEAFEELGDITAARRTYSEMLDDPGLAEFPEAAVAAKHLERLGGRIEEPQPASAPAPATPTEAPVPPASS